MEVLRKKKLVADSKKKTTMSYKLSQLMEKTMAKSRPDLSIRTKKKEERKPS